MKYTIKFIVLVIAILIICVERDCIANEKDEAAAGKIGLKSLISVSADVDKTKVTIGEKIRFEIRIDAPEEVEVLFTDISDKLGALTLVDSGTEGPGRDGESITLIMWHVLETYTIGSQFIPAIEIRHRKKDEEKIRVAKTPEIFIEVISLLGENASDIRGIKPPVSLKKNYFRLYIVIAIAFAVLGIAGGIVLFWYNRKRGGKIDFAPKPLLAHETAYIELESLKSLNLISKGRIKEHYYRLSNIVRRYIEDRFRLMAPERTTEEFLAEMAITHKLDEKHKQLISNFLEHCDLVKYAKYGPDNQEIEGSFNSAKKLVDETKEVLHDKVSVRKVKVLDEATV